MSKFKKVAVLMATYNGEKWIKPQIKSILSQKNVDVKIIVRDDRSSDDTVKLINKIKKKNNIQIKINRQNQRSASLNFLKLILNANEKYDFYAFSDQDDIWKQNKLFRAIKKIEQNKCEAYSSNISITKNKQKILMNKSDNQKKYDYIFEGVPGCTIVLTRKSYLMIRKKLIELNENQLRNISMHDTFIYFFLRSKKIPWYIDKFSFIDYRQHESNVVGVNYGLGFSKKKLNGVKKRLKIITSGYYRDSILHLAKITSINNWVIKSIKRLNFTDRLRLISSIFQFRRSKLDCFFLVLILCIIKK